MIKIVTWNINSIRSRLEILKKYLIEFKPDIVLLQETKCVDESFPYTEIEDLGYNIAVHGQKTYNGVAILSKFKIDNVIKNLSNFEDPQARYIEGEISLPGSALRVASIYVPNGNSPESEKFIYKKEFLCALKDHMDELIKYKEPIFLGGDYNIAPDNIDVYNPTSLNGSICFHPEERKIYRSLLNIGYADIYRLFEDKQNFTWWDYRGNSWQYNKGYRIDHILTSPEATDLVKEVGIDSELRSYDKPSDHAPMWCKI